MSLYPLFSLEKGYINFVPKSVCRPSVCLCVGVLSVTFLVNASPKLLDIATVNSAGAYIMMWRELSNILCDLDFGIKVKECIFL